MDIQSALASGMGGAGHAVARWPRMVFMFEAMTCLSVSTATHLLASHSRRFNRLFWQLNYAGYGELFSRYIDDPDFQFRV
ncbi:heptahelical transmembrane protein ADIPOR2-like [Hordeum vulgare]|nr:heptahelical transmembrane protein ADIPOR2-like [Hordeum vulgare]